MDRLEHMKIVKQQQKNHLFPELSIHLNDLDLFIK